jgi:hypothetical protein
MASWVIQAAIEAASISSTLALDHSNSTLPAHREGCGMVLIQHVGGEELVAHNGTVPQLDMIGLSQFLSLMSKEVARDHDRFAAFVMRFRGDDLLDRPEADEPLCSFRLNGYLRVVLCKDQICAIVVEPRRSSLVEGNLFDRGRISSPPRDRVLPRSER